MPRPTYGQEPKRRTTKLLALLIDYANDELDVDEKALDGLRSHIQVSWQTDQKLVVRTKVRSLQALSKLVTPTQPLTGEQIKESLRRLEDFLEILEDNRPAASGSETRHFTLKLWHGRRDRTALVQRLETEWETRRPLKSKQISEPPLVVKNTENLESIENKKNIKNTENFENDPWKTWCHDSLEAQNLTRLTSNPLTVRHGMTFEWRSLYVPLGVVARPSASEGEDDDEPIPVLSPDEFLTQLLAATSYCRVAIVGAAGTGKTTLLQKLAWGLLAQGQLPLWISLADLQGVSLEQFLLEDWLKTATQQMRVSPELQQQLATQVQQGRVWLLLDAVDEMAAESSVALSTIARQLRGWLSHAHVILTCRSHVWDSGKNRLESFECYRNLTFSPEEKFPIQQFIQQWFLEQPELGDRLISELIKSERRQIYNTVQNPLRLALLCRAWALHQGFPSTQSMLYDQFVEALYDWKQDIMPTSLGQRQRLNRALGNLAIAALRHSHIKFRLRHTFVCQVWGEEVAELLPLAIHLGWLNPVGTGASEKIYAFYHPTFQEYFAAQAIADWQHILGEDWLTQILASQWREVVLFWLGRLDVDRTRKENLIESLMQFPDATGGFHRYRAHFLAAEGLAEFPESQQAEAIVQQLVLWRFGHYNSEQDAWQWYPHPLQAGSLTALMQTDRAIAITVYVWYLQTQPAFFARWNAAYSLGNALSPRHPLAIQTLRELIQEATSASFKIQLSNALARLSPGDKLAIATLEQILRNGEADGIRRRAAYSLGRIDATHRMAIATLERLVQSAEPTVKRQAATSLAQLLPEHPWGQPQPTRKPRHLKPQPSRPESTFAREIDALVMKLQQPQHRDAQMQYATRLGRLVPGHALAFQVLLGQLLQPDQDAATYRRVGDRLMEILSPESVPSVVQVLKAWVERVEQGDRSAQALGCHRVMWQIAQSMNYETFAQLWH